MSRAGRPSVRESAPDPFRRGPARIPHSCGHLIDWRGTGGSLAWSGFRLGLAEYPCPWCGGETAQVRPPANVALVSFGDVPGLRDVTAERVSS